MLIYSHDSFGLGHLRRCRAIAQSPVAYRDDLSIMMIVGSPIVGAFSFSPNVEFIRVPGVVKLNNESYQPHSPGLSIDDLIAIRSSIILETARIFEPDIFLVDKEPLGLRGEVASTLEFLKSKGKTLVLGLRDVMDDPTRLAGEWERKRAIPALEDLYDHIWIYGIEEICDPLEGIDVSDSVRQKSRFTGYLRRGKTPSGLYPPPHEIEEPFYLVTTGGGGDGAMLVDWVLRAYEFDPTFDMPAKIVLGPFMGTSQQTGFMERVARIKHIEAIAFEANMEALMQRALAVVAMGGYNTFCEILSLDKRALILPRTAPRAEQYIRAKRASDLGLVSMLLPDDTTDPGQMADALRALPYRRRPSKVHIPGLLDGLSVVNSLVDQYLGDKVPSVRSPRLSLVSGNG
jgi:predicted glycosyltransferase